MGGYFLIIKRWLKDTFRDRPTRPPVPSNPVFFFFRETLDARDTKILEFCHGHFRFFTGIFSEIFTG